MRSAFAVFLRGFVLPFGSTGRRIEFDGLLGEIRFVDSLGRVRITIGPAANPDQITFHTGRSGEIGPARINAFAAGADGSVQERMGLELASGDIVGAGRDRAFMDLLSETRDGVNPAVINLYSDNNEVRVRANARQMALGLLQGGQFLDTATDDSARAAGVNTDMSVTATFIAGDAYEVTLNSHVAFGTAGAVYAVDLHDGTNTVGRFTRKVPAETPAGSTLHYIGSTVDYFPASSGSQTLTVRNASGSGGTIAMQRSTPGYRSLTVKHVGQV